MIVLGCLSSNLFSQEETAVLEIGTDAVINNSVNIRAYEVKVDGKLENEGRMEFSRAFQNFGEYKGEGDLYITGPDSTFIYCTDTIAEMVISKTTSTGEPLPIVQSQDSLYITSRLSIQAGVLDLNDFTLRFIHEEDSPIVYTGPKGFAKDGTYHHDLNLNTDHIAVDFPSGAGEERMMLAIGIFEPVVQEEAYFRGDFIPSYHPDAPASQDYVEGYWDLRWGGFDFGWTINEVYTAVDNVQGDYMMCKINVRDGDEWSSETLLPLEGDFQTQTLFGLNDSQVRFFGPDDVLGDIMVFNPIILGCATDFDGSGSVNTGDLLLLLSELGCAESCTTDLDGNGIVNTSDLLAFLGDFGSECF